MRILFDTNVVLDVLLERSPYVLAASRLMVFVEQGRLNGLLGATTVTTIHYLATKAVGPRAAKQHVQSLLSLFEIAPVGRAVLSDALSLGFRDYEDAVLHEVARHALATGLVTRDPGGFRKASLHVYAPEELVHIIHTISPA